jgi:hypothetical protein
MFAQLSGRQVREIQLFAQVRAEQDGKGKQTPEAIEDQLMAFADAHNREWAKKHKE